jgi:hypothetical protein
MIPTDHLLRRINVFATAVLADLHQQLKGFYTDSGRPSVDPEAQGNPVVVFAGQRGDAQPGAAPKRFLNRKAN